MAIPPRMNAKQRTILAIIATDTTFERALAGEREVWSGKCLHCNDGRPPRAENRSIPLCRGTKLVARFRPRRERLVALLEFLVLRLTLRRAIVHANVVRLGADPLAPGPSPVTRCTVLLLHVQ